MHDYSAFPVLNAVLNAASAVLVLTGVVLIKRKRRTAHQRVMLAALIASSLFLASYLYYHFHVGSVRFHGQGFARNFYFAILTSHTILAAVIVPMVGITLTRAFRGRFDRHRSFARWTYPLWLYVSVTGVVIYFMLYRLYAI